MEEIICKRTKKKKTQGGQQPLCVHITRYVSLDEGSAALTGRMNQDGCDALGAGSLQRLVATQEQLGVKKATFNGLNYNKAISGAPCSKTV